MLYPIGDEESLGLLIIGFILFGLPVTLLMINWGYEFNGLLLILLSIVGAFIFSIINRRFVRRRQKKQSASDETFYVSQDGKVMTNNEYNKHSKK